MRRPAAPRILWSSQWLIPQVVESASLDGYHNHRMQVALCKRPNRHPWQQIADYKVRALHNFYD